ncbi:hypothetical protein LTSEJOH_4040 [Salmonella enterica subsp. enterica serovar Johannesburg str. S5-703]|nr:hypothetical protein LTSEJOH_4040 [Salmonella enterica subsp. enterica serovar Johannesburg str. S5-703]
MLPISPVPLKVGVVSFVAPLLPMLPIIGATLLYRRDVIADCAISARRYR